MGLDEQLGAVLRELEAYITGDADLQHSVEGAIVHCGLMVKLWTIKLQMASEKGSFRELDASSKQLAEWQKRFLAAQEKRKYDLLPRALELLERLGRTEDLLEVLQ